MKLFAHAKINLCLDVLGKTANGYHKVQTIMQEIPQIKDEVTITSTKHSDKISILEAHKNSDQFRLIKTEESLVYNALQLIKKTYKIKKFAKITIKKGIPFSSGLGGDSSDSAALLKGLNKLWGLNLSTKKLLSLAENLGTDVPFFIIGKTAFATHFGEKVKKLPSLVPLLHITLKSSSPSRLPIITKSLTVNHFQKVRTKTFPGDNRTTPSLFISIIPKSANLKRKTALAYEKLDLKKCGKNKSKTAKILKAIKSGDTKTIFENIHNDFETLKIYKNLKKNEHLSGSGPSTFLLKD